MTRRTLNAILMAVLLGLAAPGSARAAVRILVGPTPIPDGEARSGRDITVINDRLAFSLAVDTAVPFGLPRGALIDAAPVSDGRIGRDRLVFADFIPNDWSAWPNTYHRVEIVEQTVERAVVSATRDWGHVSITTVYTLTADADAIEIQTTMHNEGSEALTGLLSGVTLWPKGGFFFGVPGLAAQKAGPADGALSDRVVAYDEGWSLALHAPYFDYVDFYSRDMYRQHSLAAGESRDFTAWLQVSASADLGPVIQAETARKQLPSGTIQGLVRASNGKPIDEPVIVIEKRGKPYAWVLGHGGKFQLALPAGRYALYATARNYSQSHTQPVTVIAGKDTRRDFRDLAPPGRLRLSVKDSHNGRPLDARIAITEGRTPVVEFLGRKTFFTALDRRGELDVPLAPGKYRFAISAGGGFLASFRELSLKVDSARTQSQSVRLTPRYNPSARDWYSADLHHHADQAEAVTPPADLARSQLAAGLDLLFVSDHDSTANHELLQQIADRRAVPFIPAIEFSPSWSHFNAYPLLPGQTLQIDTSTATVDQVFAEARRQGALVVQVNHPFNPYGYFSSLAVGEVPGGFNPHFELIEINGVEPHDDDRVLHALWSFWNDGHHYYLSGGSDVHDVWSQESGRVRTFAHIPGKPSAQGFAEALVSGHAYVSYGPLLYPEVMFGSELKLKPGETFRLGFDLESVNGLKQATLIERGETANTQSYPDGAHTAHLDIALTATRTGWYQLIVEDQLGCKAYADPIWIDVIGTPQFR
ncbi:MAG TPA: CehA/McbA family metallohydrolase [Steroidobacteraceae bacterium]|nr:CehA/McbA family metallohydrolase [Steroidobacteraceae bacterium]